ncbi:MAG: restriction endonuclease subunit S [Campylobacterota bacterium]|nr:restriction endonuclease subunit S [Campylobacterota bacterium]
MVADGYKDTEIGVIPIEWDVAKLETICDVRDGTHDSPKYQENGIPFITSKHLTDNGVDFSDVNYISNEDHINFSKRSLVENGDILFGMIGTIGKPLIVNYDFEFSIKNVALLKFKDNTKLNNSFTLNLLKSTIIDKQFSKLSNGGVQSFIALGMIRSLKIPLPPLKEQEKIADILSTADDKIDAITSQIEKAQTLKKGLLQKLLSEGIGHSEFKDSELGKIPLSWEVVKIGSILELLTDYHANGSYEKLSENVSLLEKEDYSIMVRTTNFEKNNFKDNLIYIDEFAYNYLKKSKVYEHDIIINKIANAGATYLMPKIDKPVSLAMNLFLLRFNDSALQQYIYFQIKKNEDRLKLLASGTSTKTITKDDVRGFKILLPPLEEQKQIADILSTADEKLEVLRAKKEKYETLKKGLLQKLLSGEVRV